MVIGREQRHHPDYGPMEKVYIALFGVPVVGLRIRARNLLRLLPERLDPDRILDAGSGPGVISFLLAERFPRATVTGIDLDASAVLASRKIAERGGFGNTRFEVADISGLPPEGRFDLVVCVDILEHIEDDDGAISSLAGVLAPGGTLLLHVPARYRRYPVFEIRENFQVPTHVRPGYDLDEITGKVRRAGLDVEKKGFTFNFIETLANNIGYMITRAEKKNRVVYSVAFPILNLLGWTGAGRLPKDMGAGVFVIAGKPRIGGETT